jgi:hypothetical protein
MIPELLLHLLTAKGMLRKKRHVPLLLHAEDLAEPLKRYVSLRYDRPVSNRDIVLRMDEGLTDLAAVRRASAA